MQLLLLLLEVLLVVLVLLGRVEVVLRGSGGAEPWLGLELRVVDHAGGSGMLHGRGWGRIGVLRVVLLGRVTGCRVARARRVRVVVVGTGRG